MRQKDFVHGLTAALIGPTPALIRLHYVTTNTLLLPHLPVTLSKYLFLLHGSPISPMFSPGLSHMPHVSPLCISHIPHHPMSHPALDHYMSCDSVAILILFSVTCIVYAYI